MLKFSCGLIENKDLVVSNNLIISIKLIRTKDNVKAFRFVGP